MDKNEKKITFCKLKTSFSRNFVYNLLTFRDFVKYIFTILWQIQHENNFIPTSKHRQAKVRCFLGICLHDCFIYRPNFVFRKCLKTGRYLGSNRKTVNSQGYSQLQELIKVGALTFMGTNLNCHITLTQDAIYAHLTDVHTCPIAKP